VLPEVDQELTAALEAATSAPRPREALAAVVASDPTHLAAWAALGAAAEAAAHDDRGLVEAYAYYRIGYHRGLDALRANGWRGSGYVRRSVPSNRGFLDCLAGLGRMADAIGETGEAERCTQFLAQLDPA
jgi:hypothetical protein